MTAESVTPREHLLYVASRQFEDGQTVFTGFHWPVVAQRVARRLGTDLTAVFEAGLAYRGGADRLSTSTTEVNTFAPDSEIYGNTLDTLHTFVKSGRLDGAVVDAANVDRFGNVNSSVIGSPDRPAVRLPGAGGARDILAHTENVALICGSADPQRYQDRVEYVSSPGHLDGDGSREAAGFEAGTGPRRLLTPMGRFTFDESGRAQLDALTTGTTVREVRETTGWSIPEETYPRLPLPSEDELRVVRDVMANATDRHYRSIKP